MGSPLEALKSKGNRSGKKREVQRAHHDEKRGQRRIGTVGFARPTKILRRRFSACSRMRAEARRGEIGRGRCSGARLCPLLSERGGEERSGERMWERGVPCGSEPRGGHGRAVGEEGADRRARPVSG